MLAFDIAVVTAFVCLFVCLLLEKNASWKCSTNFNN